VTGKGLRSGAFDNMAFGSPAVFAVTSFGVVDIVALLHRVGFGGHVPLRRQW